MSLNRFMHPRNIYRTKPNYAEMAAQFPSFRPFVKQDLSGKLSVDYSDRNALRALTQTLLKKDFDLEVNIPLNRLVPTVPQRLNYVLWVEDLLQRLRHCLAIDEHVMTGVDVGTGCCAIFPLIAVAIHSDWRFVATDVDPFNLECARNNVDNNQLTHKIKVIESKASIFSEAIQMISPEMVHFSMCNPPFFDDHLAVDDCDTAQDCDVEMKALNEDYRRKRWRKKSKANTSSAIESSVDGGEIAFVEKIIEESVVIRDKIAIYTVMLGKKSSLIHLKNVIKSHIDSGSLTSYAKTEFCQGKTKRWGLAWTAVSRLDLKAVPAIKTVKPKPPLVYYLPPIIKDVKYNVYSIRDRVSELLREDLQLDACDIVRDSCNLVEFMLRSNQNTWSHQRRRRRQVKSDSSMDCSDALDYKSVAINKVDDNHETEFSATNGNSNDNHKRKAEETDQIFANDCQILNSKKLKEKMEYRESQTYLLHCSLIIKKEFKTIILQMQSKESTHCKESTYQLFQYFKNKLT